jgi:signal peptidase I
MTSTQAGHVKQHFSPPASRLRGFLKFIAELALILLIVTIGKSVIAAPYYVPSGSMEPTLKLGDEFVATKYNYGYSAASLPLFIHFPASGRVFGALPKRGDVVVFRAPADPSQIWVKRVIGVPGDRISVRYGQVWISGEPVNLVPDGLGRDEGENGAYRLVPRFIETLPGGRKHLIFQESTDSPLDNMPTVIVPPGHLFVMGDNRDNSDDSRVPVSLGGVGSLPIDDLVGRVDVLLGSWNPAIAHWPFWDWPGGLRPSRFFIALK